jgi:hypothetical protein
MHKDNGEDYKLHEIKRIEDPIGAVLRAHLWIEGCLNDVLRRRMGRDFGEKVRFSYEQKIWLASALKLVPDDLREPLKVIGTFRNRMAHRVGEDISEAEQKKFLSDIPISYKRRLTKILGSLPDADQEAGSNIHHLEGLKGRRALSMEFAAGIFVLVYALWEALDNLEAG